MICECAGLEKKKKYFPMLLYFAVIPNNNNQLNIGNNFKV